MKKETKKKLQITPKFAVKVLLGILFCAIAFLAGFCEINWGKVILVTSVIGLFLTMIVSFSTIIICLIERKWMAFCISWLVFITAVVITILVGVFSYGTSVFFSRLLTTFKNERSVIFIVLLAFLLGQTIVGLFWKRARKWGLLVFTILMAIIIAIVGQVIDYVTRKDVATHYYDAQGRSYGDYGLSDSSYDKVNAYYNTKRG